MSAANCTGFDAAVQFAALIAPYGALRPTGGFFVM